MGRLTGKVALVTGAANGQGAAIARLLAREGAAVVATDIDDVGGRACVAEIAAAGDQALYLHHDVADWLSWEAAIATAVDAFGSLNILVNNAGMVTRKTIAEMGMEDWRRALDVNLTGPMIGMKLAAPVIRDSGGGSIVNNSSVAAMMAHYDAPYAASKWGLRGVTKTAAVEFAPWNIRVNSIHPGQIEGTALFASATQALTESLRASIPMGRGGTPDECANLVLFLVSDDAPFISGAEIAIDGGYTAGSTMWMRQQMKAMLAKN
jgi:3alpha(or 20beta)-hydroxysteroid dehydrogenase